MSSLTLDPSPRATASRRAPRVLELVGPPGTGKTSVAEILLASPELRARAPRLQGWRRASVLLRSAGTVAVPFATQLLRMDAHRRKRFLLMARLSMLADAVGRGGTGKVDMVVLDQGPVYTLSILQRALHPAGAARDAAAFRRYWERTLAHWARRIDWVVELEADDAELHRRIVSRGSSHPVARMALEEAGAFFERSRRSRGRILAALGCGTGLGPRLLHLRTDGVSPAQNAARVLAALAHLEGESLAPR